MKKNEFSLGTLVGVFFVGILIACIGFIFWQVGSLRDEVTDLGEAVEALKADDQTLAQGVNIVSDKVDTLINELTKE